MRVFCGGEREGGREMGREEGREKRGGVVLTLLSFLCSYTWLPLRYVLAREGSRAWGEEEVGGEGEGCNLQIREMQRLT